MGGYEMKKMLNSLVAFLLIIPNVSCVLAEEDNQGNEEIEETIADNKDTHLRDEPNNVIVMIADGMGVGQIEVARWFEHGKEGELFMETLPNLALARTYSADNRVTDSAAAGTALATGEKTNNGKVGIGPDGEVLTSILDIFKEHGKSVGVVSTNMVTDATPAAYVAKVADRWGDQGEIARQIYENDYDYVLGGGEKFFLPEKQGGNNLLEMFQDKGYEIAKTADELAKIDPISDTRILGLFHHSYMNYVGDREVLDSEEPTLVEMSEKVIDAASQNEKGFFLMLEGARVDHASHAVDIGGIWREMIAFDNAVEYVVNWAEENGNTLVIVKGDHETMGISATEPMDIEALKNIDVSPEYMAQQLIKDKKTNNYTVKSIRNVFKKHANMKVTDEEIEMFQENIVDPEGRIYANKLVGWEIGSMIASHYRAGSIDRQTRKDSNSSKGHTANMVPVFAYGPGAERFDGVLDNTEIPKMIADIAGFEFELEQDNLDE